MVAMMSEAGMHRQVICDGTLPDGSPCRQLLAEEWERGAYNIVGTTRFRTDERKRVILVCPQCHKRTRLYVADAA